MPLRFSDQMTKDQSEPVDDACIVNAGRLGAEKRIGIVATLLTDHIVRKTLIDAFFRTSLDSDLKQRGVRRVVIAGWATDLCVDAIVRSAVAAGYRVIVVGDCHTVSNRPHLSA